MLRPLLAFALVSMPALAQREVETFDDGFVNPFFSHAFEFDNCCWSFEPDPDNPDNLTLHLEPNFDMVSFDIPDGMHVRSVSVWIYDREGGFVGDQPTSVMGVRSVSGDFVILSATQIGVWTELRADVNTIGRIFNKPLGPIQSVELQAANEGNSVIIGVGAFFDDLTVELEAIECAADFDGDGDADADDFFTFLDLFASDDDAANIDGDADIDADDFFAYLDLFAVGC